MYQLTPECVCKQYPKFFEQYGAPATGYGWYPVLMTFSRELRTLCEAHGGYVVASQIKDKFGELRIYIAETSGLPGDAQQIAHLLVAWAIGKCRSTCDVCGAQGSPRNVRGLSCVRCDRHVNTRPHEADDIAQDIELADLPALDLSSLPAQGVIEIHDEIQLTVVRYRDVADISRARFSDIEIREDCGPYPDVDTAMEAARTFGCLSTTNTDPGI